jgi:hypothetical protein
VFRDLVLARIIEPVSKLDSLRVLEEAGVAVTSYRTVLRRLPVYAKDSWRQKLSAACAAHAGLGPASLVLYDVSRSTSRLTPGRVESNANRLIRATNVACQQHGLWREFRDRQLWVTGP